MDYAPKTSKPAAGPFGLAAKGRFGRFLCDRRAASVVEFAIVTPIFLALLGAAIDFGMVVRTKILLSSAVSAASNYAINNGSSFKTSDGSALALAQNLATMMASVNGANWANSTATVNWGPTVTVTGGTSSSTTTAGSAADNFYCPSGALTAATPGSGTTTSQSCGSTGLYGGKYVVLSAKRNYTPMLLPTSAFTLPTVTVGNVTSWVISASGVVQVQ